MSRNETRHAEIDDPANGSSAFELIYLPLHKGPSFAFPCDEQGVVEMNELTEQARRNYLFVRTLVGRDFQTPTVVRATS